jgi:DNA-binding response OmpR family regulator
MHQENLSALRGLRLLIVEDEPLIAMELVEECERIGAFVVGPATSVEAALDLIAAGPVDAAILDVEVQRKHVFPVAARLTESRVPFMLTSGHDAAALPACYSDAAYCAKPAPATDVLRKLSDSLSTARITAAPGASVAQGASTSPARAGL